jgi:hypothetical protein
MCVYLTVNGLGFYPKPSLLIIYLAQFFSDPCFNKLKTTFSRNKSLSLVNVQKLGEGPEEKNISGSNSLSLSQVIINYN